MPDLPLGDGTKKIFLNMTSKNGRPELVSLLQYMKNTTLNNPDIIVQDDRILDLNKIVEEVKQSEVWEAVSMNILDFGIARGIERGIEQGNAQTLIKDVESLMKNFDIDLQKACEGLGITVEKYESCKEQISLLKSMDKEKV